MFPAAAVSKLLPCLKTNVEDQAPEIRESCVIYHKMKNTLGGPRGKRNLFTYFLQNFPVMRLVFFPVAKAEFFPLKLKKAFVVITK